MSNILHKILRRVVLLSAPYISLKMYQRLLPRDLIGFFYHMVSNEHLPHVAHLYPYKTAAAFEEDILTIKRRFTLVSYHDIVAHHLGERALPPNAAFISFDDGFRECYTVARPILLQHGVPSIFFLTTAAVDNRMLVYNNKASVCVDVLRGFSYREAQSHLIRVAQAAGQEFGSIADCCAWLLQLKQADQALIDWIAVSLEVDFEAYLRNYQPYLSLEQIREMKAEGFIFGGHTRQHIKLMHLDQQEQAEEISQSCKIVADWVGESEVPFAFPFSGAYVNRAFLNRLREENPHIGLIFDINWLRKDKAPFIYNRIWVDKPVKNVPQQENIPHALHQAYRWTLVDQYRYRDF